MAEDLFFLRVCLSAAFRSYGKLRARNAETLTLGTTAEKPKPRKIRDGKSAADIRGHFHVQIPFVFILRRIFPRMSAEKFSEE